MSISQSSQTLSNVRKSIAWRKRLSHVYFVYSCAMVAAIFARPRGVIFCESLVVLCARVRYMRFVWVSEWVWMCDAWVRSRKQASVFLGELCIQVLCIYLRPHAIYRWLIHADRNTTFCVMIFRNNKTKNQTENTAWWFFKNLLHGHACIYTVDGILIWMGVNCWETGFDHLILTRILWISPKYNTETCVDV